VKSQKLSGILKKGTPVELTVLRQGDTTERFNTTIVRDKINLVYGGR
jgi:C-terminal processing protease CtpA/Prc